MCFGSADAFNGVGCSGGLPFFAPVRRLLLLPSVLWLSLHVLSEVIFYSSNALNDLFGSSVFRAFLLLALLSASSLGAAFRSCVGAPAQEGRLFVFNNWELLLPS